VLSADLVRCVSEARGVHWRLHHPEDGTVPTWWAGHVLNRMQTNRFHDRSVRLASLCVSFVLSAINS
jgi:hypothetical protein